MAASNWFRGLALPPVKCHLFNLLITFLALLSLWLLPLYGECGHWPVDHSSLAKARHHQRVAVVGQEAHTHRHSHQHPTTTNTYRAKYRRGVHSAHKNRQEGRGGGGGENITGEKQIPADGGLTGGRSAALSLHRHQQKQSASRTTTTTTTSIRRANKYKRQAAIDLAVNRLHILESLDGQLLEFVEAAHQQQQRPRYSSKQRRPQGRKKEAEVGGDNETVPSKTRREEGEADVDERKQQQQQEEEELCVLELKFGHSTFTNTSITSSNSSKNTNTNNRSYEENNTKKSKKLKVAECLADSRLRRHIPPYMLNLHRQLLSESRTLADAVRLMPYQSLVMRSFRQPPLTSSSMDIDGKLGVDESGDKGLSAIEQATANVVVELSALDDSLPPPSPNDENGSDNNSEGGDDGDRKVITFTENEGATTHITGISQLTAADNNNDDEHYLALGDSGRAQSNKRSGHSSGGKLRTRNIASDNNVDKIANHDTLSPNSLYATAAASSSSSASASSGEQTAHRFACDLSQRLLLAHERSELCYWFNISEQLRMKINGSLVKSTESSSQRRERLVEAELHVFKLLPELSVLVEPSATIVESSSSSAAASGGSNYMNSNEENSKSDVTGPWHHSSDSNLATRAVMVSEGEGIEQQLHQEHLQLQLQQQQASITRRLHKLSTRRQANDGHNHSMSTNNLYHLKTNLLEVSLYQILPKKTSSYTTSSSDNNNNSSSSNHEKGYLDKEFPLRLLDIRRIDLDSSGWETFYVKRAVDDWVNDSSLNLGLVIKAKSMFEEPIRIGLIRFADLYDHHQTDRHDSERSQRREIAPIGTRQQREETLEFDMNHQPILVIYTTIAGEK